MIVGSSGQGMVLLGSWWPHAITEREHRRIRRTTVAHRIASVAEIQVAVGTTVTQRAVRNRLLQGCLQAKRPVARIPWTPSHCRL
ncbi:uncharacterized protein TNCV_2452241 [Trichonephila clavipes]|nr:uncharacterized protein TNCV_4543751 [Trichonephila clavipes]GFT45299.1 uncharacterized protein TNCV_2452241 [Trichonephila clavipes]